MLAAAVFLPLGSEAVSAKRAYVLDAVSGQKTYTYIDADGEHHVVWYEDAESAARKFPLVEKYNLKGLDLAGMKAVLQEAIWNKPVWHGDLDAVHRSLAGRNMNQIG